MRITWIILLCVVSFGLAAAETGDQWISVPTTSDQTAPGTRQEGFESLKAEVIIGKLNIFWRADQIPATSATLHYSPDHPGHWAAREWKELPMRKRQNLFDVKLPVHDVDLPIVYFVSGKTNGGTVNSPARQVVPRQASMDKPSSVFWPFAEGFEVNARNWTVSSSASFSTDARSGNRSLEIRVPADKHSVSASTTRVRGWHFLNQRARSIRVWLKATAPGKVQFTLAANARTPNQTVARSRQTTSITPAWQAVDVPLNSFPLRDVAGIDLFTIEFVGPSGSALRIDDLQFVGPWLVKGI